MIKSLLYSLVVLVSSPAIAETPEQFFDQGNQAYQSGKFAEAIQKYEAILQSGNMSGELYYNLGNSYYKSGDLARAVLYYERALKLTPNDDDLRHNLQLANLNIVDRIEPTPRLFLWDWWDAIKSSFSLNSITWLSYEFFVLMILSIVGILFAGSYAIRRISLFAGMASFVLLCVSLTIFVGKLNAINDRNTAIVIAHIATIKNSPDTKSSDAFVLHSGVKVSITDRVKEWFKIRLADGKVGWMEQKAAEII
jgi:tetratricopeptide (TPR) repeat protein